MKMKILIIFSDWKTLKTKTHNLTKIFNQKVVILKVLPFEMSHAAVNITN